MTDTVFDVVDVDGDGIVDVPAIGEADQCNVKDCTNEVAPYSGRGPRPKRCTEHKVQRATGGSGTSHGTRGASWQVPLQRAVTGQIASIGLVVMVLDQFDGQCIMAGADQLATALVTVADGNKNVRKALESMVTAGAWAGVATAVAAIALPIMQHHGVLPSGINLGGGKPDGGETVGV